MGKLLTMPTPARAAIAGFDWTRQQSLGLSSPTCKTCKGRGLIDGGAKGKARPCKCVTRAIFRILFRRYQIASNSTGLTFERPTSAGKFSSNWGYRRIEFAADFCILARRVLTAEEFRIFTIHYLQERGGGYKASAVKTKIDKGNFFHAIYKIQDRIGRAARELEPYSLFPLDEYFGGTKREAQATKVIEMPRLRLSSLIPIRKIAA